MGKKKHAQRTKDNVVPASSGRSAELLQSTSNVQFVGLSALKEGGYIPIMSGVSDELDFNINEDFRLVWKKMNKKDTTTKLKALDEFKKLCQESDLEALKPVLPYWPRLFCVLSTDEEHRVREAAHAAHKALVGKAGRNIAPYLKQLVGPWFTGQHDTYPPAASTAESAFQETFPPNKLVEAIVFCQEEILNYIINNLLNQTPQTLTNNQNCSQEMKDARYQRVMISCLSGYALYLQRLPAEHLHKAEEANRKLVSAAKFWEFSKDPAPHVRSAWFTALVTLCEKAPFLLAGEAKHICSAVFNNMDDTDPGVVRNVWEAVLLSFNVVEDVWKHVSLEKLVLPKLWKVLKAGADGNASRIFPNLLPLLSKISTSLLQNKANFYTKFFENLRTGLKARNVQISAKEAGAVVVAFLECLRYVISINYEEQQICVALLEEQVFPLLDCVMSDSKLQLACPGLFSGLASLVNHWSLQACQPYTTLTASFWGRLAGTSAAALENHRVDEATLATNCASLQSLLTSFKHPDSQPRKNFKVKFVSPRKSQEEIEEPIYPITEQPILAVSFREELNKLVYKQLSICFNLLEECSGRARVVFVIHLARVLEEYNSPDVFSHVLNISQLSWTEFYRQRLARWLRDDNIPLDYSLRVIFSLLSHVQDDDDVQTVFADLSGEEILAVEFDGSEPQLEPLYVKWQNVLEWALCPDNQTACVQRWISRHGDMCRLATSLSRREPSYNILHNCLRNLQLSTWLSTDSLRDLVRCLRHNLTDSYVVDNVKACSGDLVKTMLQNTSNHTVLARLPTADLQQLLYELLTATLQHLPHFPQCWQHCVTVLSLQTGADLTFSAVCETCVDLFVAVVRTRPMDLSESKQLVCVLEDLIDAAVEAVPADSQVADTTASLTAVVLHRLAARVKEHSGAVWSLYVLAESVAGTLKNNPLPYKQLISLVSKDPLAAVPLQQYVTSMIPFLMMVVKLQTEANTSDTEDTYTEDFNQFPYSQLRSALAIEDLWDWTLQILYFMCFCVSFKERFISTKQYFMLKEKITFVIEECGLFCQLRGKDLMKHLDSSSCDEKDTSLLECDVLSRLQEQVLLKNLGLLYNTRLIQKGLIPFKSINDTVMHYYFPEEVLEEISHVVVDRAQLPVVNTLYSRLAALQQDAENCSGTTYISIMDSVFDLHVSELKDNRSLLELPDSELCHIAEVADFACHSVSHHSAHMKQSSWDSCLVATAALTLSVDSTLKEWSERQTIPLAPPSPPAETTPTTTSQFWPMSLLSESNTVSEDVPKDFIRLPLVRVVCSVCRLFDAVSVHMGAVEEEDKAARTRHQEWTDVFLPGTHAAITSAWMAVTGMPCEQPSMMLMVEALSSSFAKFVQYPHFVDDSPLACLSTYCRLLQSTEASVQLAAYHTLVKLIPALIELDMKECEDNVALSCKHVDQTLVFAQGIIETILSGLSFGDTCIVEPFTDSYTYVRCYLLLWCALLEMCTQAGSQLRALYTTWLKEEYLSVLMKTVFCLMPEAALHGDVTSQRLAQHFSKPPQLEKGVWGSERLAQLSCWVFACGLRHLPAAIRQWWNEADHKVYTLVEHVTSTYVSPDLCAEEMRAIQLHEKKFDNMTVHVLSTAKEVYAVYTVEESRMELVIELAHNHPLGLVKVKSGQRMVSTTQTRQWLLQITIFLTHQNGSIWDALELWKNSLDKRFEGVEECYICFAILHSVSHQLPKLSCQTCRKKFHSHCLFKWFTTSNKSTCPICRNLF